MGRGDDLTAQAAPHVRARSTASTDRSPGRSAEPRSSSAGRSGHRRPGDVLVEPLPLKPGRGKGVHQQPAQLLLDAPGRPDLASPVVGGEDVIEAFSVPSRQGVVAAEQQRQPVRPGQVDLAAASVMAVPGDPATDRRHGVVGQLHQVMVVDPEPRHGQQPADRRPERTEGSIATTSSRRRHHLGCASSQVRTAVESRPLNRSMTSSLVRSTRQVILGSTRRQVLEAAQLAVSWPTVLRQLPAAMAAVLRSEAQRVPATGAHSGTALHPRRRAGREDRDRKVSSNGQVRCVSSSMPAPRGVLAAGAPPRG